LRRGGSRFGVRIFVVCCWANYRVDAANGQDADEHQPSENHR